MTVPFVIAVRTYNRPDLFGQRTLKVLTEHGLLDRLTVFVGSDISAYRAVYPDLTYVQAPPGAHRATEAICNHYPRGTPIVFLDDDLHGYFELDASGAKIRGDLKAAIEFGFSLGPEPFQFSPITNRSWMAPRPPVSKRYVGLMAYAFGALNEPELIIAPYGAHSEEPYRSVQYFKRGIVPNVLNRCALWTKGWGKTPGGLQDLGRNLAETKAETAAVAAACEGWVGAPFLNEKAGFWQVLMLPAGTIKRRLATLSP